MYPTLIDRLQKIYVTNGTCLPYPHYLKPVSGIQMVENGEKWRREGTRQRKEERPLYPHPLVICFSQPLIFELSPPSECLEQAAISYYLNWTKNQTTMKSLQVWFKSNFTIVNDHLIWVLYLALCCSFSPPTVLKMSSKSLTADWHANNFLPAK